MAQALKNFHGDINKAIWNPNAVVNWSVFLSPVFGSYLLMQNWQILGLTEKAVSAKKWFYVSIAFAFLGFSRYAIVFWPVYLLVWYFVFARAHSRYVNNQYGAYYHRKSWKYPLLNGFALNSVFWVCILYSYGLINLREDTDYLPPKRKNNKYLAEHIWSGNSGASL